MELRPKACMNNRKNLLNSNISSACTHNMANFGPEVGLPVWGTVAKFNGFPVLPSLLQRRCSPEANYAHFARCFAVSWASTGTLYIHFWGLLPPDEILSGAIFTLCPSLAFSYICSVTLAAGVSQTLWRGRANGITELSQRAPPIFGWTVITLGIGPHSSLENMRVCKDVNDYITRLKQQK